jgi:hypothetical protein
MRCQIARRASERISLTTHRRKHWSLGAREGKLLLPCATEKGRWAERPRLAPVPHWRRTMIAFHCPACSKRLNTKDQFAGRKTQCPKCASTITVPAASPAVRESTSDSDRAAKAPPPGLPQPPRADHTPPATVPVTCPECKRIINLSPADLALTIECARCSTRFVPRPPAAPQSQPAETDPPPVRLPSRAIPNSSAPPPVVVHVQQVNSPPPYVFVTATKSMGISILLTLLFGPLGMLYSTVPGALAMIAVNLLLHLCTGCVGALTLGFGLILFVPIQFFANLICVVWGAMATNSYNQKLLQSGDQNDRTAWPSRPENEPADANEERGEGAGNSFRNQSESPASSVKGLYISAAPVEHVDPPPLSNNSPSQPTASETGTCAFCCAPMALEAVKCSACQNWRQDIHLLMLDYRRMATTQLVGIAIGFLGTVVLLIAAVAGAVSARDGSFSFGKFVRSPLLWLAVCTVVLTGMLFVSLQVPAARIGNQLQQMTRGLWQRWKV